MTNVDHAKRPGGALRVVCLACASAALAWPWLARADEPPQSGRAPSAQAAAPNKAREPYLEAEPLREALAAEFRKVDNLAADLAKASAQLEGLAKSDAVSITGRNEVNKALKSVQSALISYKTTVSSQSVQEILDPYSKEERADALNFFKKAKGEKDVDEWLDSEAVFDDDFPDVNRKDAGLAMAIDACRRFNLNGRGLDLADRFVKLYPESPHMPMVRTRRAFFLARLNQPEAAKREAQRVIDAWPLELESADALRLLQDLKASKKRR